MGHWMSPMQFAEELDARFPGCMAGRIMYVIPFSMGPLGSPLSKIGIQVNLERRNFWKNIFKKNYKPPGTTTTEPASTAAATFKRELKRAIIGEIRFIIRKCSFIW